jgi:transposase
MGRSGFLSAADRQTLVELSRVRLAQHRLARRANALVPLDRGMSYREVATVLLIDDDTMRKWRQVFASDGVEALADIHFRGSQPLLAAEQEAELTTSVSHHLQPGWTGAGSKE